MKYFRNTAKYLYFIFFTVLFFTIPVHAYLDPSVMTYAIQAIAGIAVALGAFFGVYWRKIRRVISRQIGQENSKNQNAETDVVKYTDPKSGKMYVSAVSSDRQSNHVSDKEEKRSVKSFSVCFYVSLAIAYLFCFFGPLEIFMTNKKSFWFDFSFAWPKFLMLALACFAVLVIAFAAAYLIYDRFFYTSVFLALAVLVTTFIQGQFMSGRLPLLDGSPIDWDHYRIDMVKSGLLLIAVCLILVIARKYLHRKGFDLLTKGLSSLTIVFMTLVLLLVGINSDGFADKKQINITERNLWKYSEKENYIIFVVDAVDSGYFKTVLNDNPEYKDTFNDFTYYPDTLSAYSYTQCAIPYFFSGRWITDNVTIADYNTDAFNDSPLLDMMEAEDYEINVYSPEIIMDNVKIDRINNITDDLYQLKSLKGLYFNMLKLVGFKYAPYYLKPLYFIDMDKFKKLKSDKTTAGDKEFSHYNYIFRKDYKNTDMELTDRKQFKFIHIEGAHPPYRYDKDANKLEKNTGSYYENVQAAYVMIKEYLAKLKENGVYDNSVIIICADHGYNPEWDNEIDKPNPVGRHNPLLMIKGRNEKHDELTVSEKEIAYTDLQDAYPILFDGGSNADIFPFAEGVQRDRYYYFFNLYVDRERYREQVLRGNADDVSNLTDTGKIIIRIPAW